MSLKCPIWNYKCWSKVELPWFVRELSLFMCFKSELPTEKLQKSVNRISSNIYRQIKSGFLSLKFKKRWNCCWNQVVNVNHSSTINTICLHCMENRLHEYVEQKKKNVKKPPPKKYIYICKNEAGENTLFDLARLGFQSIFVLCKLCDTMKKKCQIRGKVWTYIS